MEWVHWACDEKRVPGGLSEGSQWYRGAREEEEDRTSDDETGQCGRRSEEKEYKTEQHGDIFHRTSTPNKNGTKMKKKKDVKGCCKTEPPVRISDHIKLHTAFNTYNK